MPISNPIIQGLTVNIISGGANITLDTTNPQIAPLEAKSFWFNSVARRLFLAIATASVEDWIEIAGNGISEVDWEAIANKPSVFPVDTASILNKILVQNGEVLTTETNVIFED